MLLFFSCKKEYTCSCSTTMVGGSVFNGQGYFVSKSEPMDSKMTEKQAKAVCAHEAEAIDETYKNIFTGNGTQSSQGWYTKTNCTLQ